MFLSRMAALRGLSLRCRRAFSSSADRTPSHLKGIPRDTRAVVIGGGVIGSSVAYHLSERGWRDIVMVEQGQLTCGTTWHAAGLIGQLRQTETETRLSKYGSQLYSELEELTGQATGWKQCGSLTVARNHDRMHNLQVSCSRARSFGIEAHLVQPAECAQLWPLMKVDDLVGALWLPGDGTANASDVSAALATGAKQRGTRILEQTRCVGVERGRDGRVRAVQVERRRPADGPQAVERARIECEVVVNCAGMWAREEGRRAGVSVPLQAAEHFYVVTEALDGVTADTPVMRDPDGWTYFREWSGGLILGGFEPNAKPCFPGGRIPDRFEFQLFDEDWDHFSILMENGLLRVPAMESAQIRQMVNGPESFTIDNQYVLGEAPELGNYYVAAGFNSSGIASAGGAGKALAEWIDLGRPPFDLWTVRTTADVVAIFVLLFRIRFSPHPLCLCLFCFWLCFLASFFFVDDWQTSLILIVFQFNRWTFVALVPFRPIPTSCVTVPKKPWDCTTRWAGLVGRSSPHDRCASLHCTNGYVNVERCSDRRWDGSVSTTLHAKTSRPR
jgi:glycine/D-amino acid oxidase-like deaminating enzyme